MKTSWVLATAVAFGAAAASLRAADPGEDFQKYVRESKDFQSVAFKKDVIQPAGAGIMDRDALALPVGARVRRRPGQGTRRRRFQRGLLRSPAGRRRRAQREVRLYVVLDHMRARVSSSRERNSRARRTGSSPIALRACLIPTEQANRRKTVEAAITKAKAFKTRAAYALDDEVSWSTFTSPSKWDNNPLSLADYARWLKERYGSEAALKQQWTAARPRAWRGLVDWGKWPRAAPRRPISSSAWPIRTTSRRSSSSRWTSGTVRVLRRALLHGSQFNNVVGDFVTFANTLDPETPCGFVGGGCPAAYGGFDYAKTTRKIQYIEAYDIGGSMEVCRSLFPATWCRPSAPASATWRAKQRVAQLVLHGPRRPRRDHVGGGLVHPEDALERIKSFGPTIQRLAERSRKIYGGTWMHDGVALYYSHPSIQMSWFIDIETHGKTWPSRSSSLNNSLASTVGTTWAWMKYLEDQRAQYNGTRTPTC